MSFLKYTCIAAAVAAVPLTADAVTTLQIDSVTGVWTSSVGGSNVNGVGTNTLSWGGGNPQSSYVFTGDAPPAFGGILPGAVFDLGTFTHNNFPILLPAISMATLAVDVTGTLFLDGVNSGVFSIMSTFDFEHNETPNSLPCDPTGATICPDVVTLMLNEGASETIEIDGVSYILDITGFVVGGVLVDQYVTEENQENDAILQGRFREVTSVIPVPAALPLFLSALAGFGFMSRRRRAAANA
jgi:hypothetical protein